jgi:hypothetical protein
MIGSGPGTVAGAVRGFCVMLTVPEAVKVTPVTNAVGSAGSIISEGSIPTMRNSLKPEAFMFKRLRVVPAIRE